MPEAFPWFPRELKHRASGRTRALKSAVQFIRMLYPENCTSRSFFLMSKHNARAAIQTKDVLLEILVAVGVHLYKM